MRHALSSTILCCFAVGCVAVVGFGARVRLSRRVATIVVGVTCVLLALLSWVVTMINPSCGVLLAVVGTPLGLMGLLIAWRLLRPRAVLPAAATICAVVVLWGILAAQDRAPWGKGDLTARSECMSHLYSIGHALGMYRCDSGGALPPDLKTLYLNSYDPRAWWVFLCPADRDVARSGPGFRTSYAYVGTLSPETGGLTIIAFEKRNNHRSGRSVLFGDGHVEWLTEKELRAQLRKSLGEVKRVGWAGYSEKRRREIEAFYTNGSSPRK